MSQYDAMLFDLDGVVTRNATVHAAAWKQLFDDFLRSWSEAQGVPCSPFEQADYDQYMDGRPRYQAVAAFLRARGIDLPYGAPDDPPDALTACALGNRKNRYFAEALERVSVHVFADAVTLIDALRQADKRLALISSSQNCEAILRRAGLLDRFDVLVTGIDGRKLGLAGKPDPDSFLIAAERLGVEPARAVVFEDASVGVQAGRAGNFGLVIGVDRRGDPSPLLTSGADAVVSDLAALLPIWPDPSARAATMVEAVTDRTFEAVVICLPRDSDPADFQPLQSLLAQARDLGIEVVFLGLPDADANATTDEAGTDDAGASTRAPTLAAALEQCEERGIGSGLVLVVGWIAGLEVPEGTRAALVSVEGDPPEPGALAPQALWIGGNMLGLVALIDEQLNRRRTGRVPTLDGDPRWTVVVKGGEQALRRAHASLLTVADGLFGTRGVREEDSAGSFPRVVAGGVFDESPRFPSLLEGPIWTSLQLSTSWDGAVDTRLFDLRTGALFREQPAHPVPLRSFRFASLARPGTKCLRAEGGMEWLQLGPGLRAPASDGTFLRSQRQGWATARTTTGKGGAIAAAAGQRAGTADGRRTAERLAVYVSDPDGADTTAQAAARLDEVMEVGFDRLFAENRAAWAQRWRDAEVSLIGDAHLELAVRFVLFHLMASAPTSGEAAVGPRGLTGPAYGGHVFWDTDVFVLPFFASTCPGAARAMLEYRIRRLDVARRAAEGRGLRGLRFPWESARDGTDVTPVSARNTRGELVPIRTGEHEEHIMADVAWAALHYAAWSGDDAFLRGPGAPLVLDTARYWASRVRFEQAGAVRRGHLYGVIGPDEYHEPVDDNAYTNVMARWNLRQAAQLAEATGLAGEDEIREWRSVADSLVDGFDPASGLYEQFAGYNRLEPLVISDLAETPVAADLLFGRPRIQASQILKQPDVLMLFHLVPDELAPGSMGPNIDYYEPRCAHGSSLSPAIHASLMARAGRQDDALRLFRMACLLDFDDLTGTTSSGLHIATFGGVWQALAFGFLGLRAMPDHLLVDPHVPSAWEELAMRVRFHGQRLRVTAHQDDFTLVPEAPLTVDVPGAGRHEVAPPGTTWRRAGDGWEVAR